MSRLRLVPALWIALLATGPAAGAGAAGAERLQERIRSTVAQRAGLPAAAVRVPRLGDFSAVLDRHPGARVRLSTHPDEDFDGTTPVTVSLRAAGRELKRGVVSVDVRRERVVWKAARALPAGHRIGAADLVADSLERPPPPDRIADPALLLGRETTRFVAEGTPWRAKLVREPPAVSRGDRVVLRIQSGALRIDGVGQARESAARGERVRVLNLDSRREIVGVVGADGVVHVVF